MWQKFSDEARKAMAVAEEEAAKGGKMVISTEHMLVGLMKAEASAAAGVLARLGVHLGAVEAEVAKLEPDPVGKKPRTKVILSRDAKRAIDATYQEAMDMKDKIIDTEHLLIGLVAQGGAATKILANLGANLEKVRKAVHELPKAVAPGLDE